MGQGGELRDDRFTFGGSQKVVRVVMTNEGAASRVPQVRDAEQAIVRVLSIVFVVGVAAIVSQPLFSHSPWMTFLQDDCFYYLKVAQNIAQGHGSTFGGIAPTNGYQPLWLWTLTGLCLLTSSPKWLLFFFALANFVASATTFLLARRLLRLTKVRPLLSFALSALVTLYSLMLFFYGMETTLTVPLFFAVVNVLTELDAWSQSPSRSFWFGVLLAALTLSRIDSLIFIALAGLCLCLSEHRRIWATKAVVYVATGFLPVPLYFIANHHYFGTWLPVSGLAKQLRRTHVPSLEPWKVFFHPLAGSYAVLIVVALLMWPVMRKKASFSWAFPAALLFPFVYYFILSCVSDWTLWGWYMYPLRVAICVSLVILCMWRKSAVFLQRSVVSWLLVASVFMALAAMRWRRQQEDINAAAVEIAEFAENHPGTYAMGDRAGRVGYKLHSPLLQTEGLMMDKPYLENISQQRPLREVLKRYNVHYYVATAYEPFTGCFQAAEPAKAGPTSDHLRGTFCDAPLATWTHDGIQTLVFGVSE